MDWTDHAVGIITQVGFPIAVAVTLLAGLHYWTIRLYRDVVLPLTAEVGRTLRCTRKQLHMQTKCLGRVADALERYHGNGRA